MQDHQTLHASTTWDTAVLMSRTIFGSQWPTFLHLILHERNILSEPYLKCGFIQDHQTLHADTSYGDGVSRTIFRTLWPTFHMSFHIKGKSCLGHTLNTVLCMPPKWYGIFCICPIYLFVIYQQTYITVQYKINLKCMFKDTRNTALWFLQNKTPDGRIMYLTFIPK